MVVAADAADVALSRVPDAHGIGVAASDVGFFAAAAAAAVLVEVPHAAGEFTAAISVVGKEFAVHLADVVLPVAHSGLVRASSLVDDLGTSGLALASGVVPHTLLVGDATNVVLSEGVASEAFVIADAVGGVPVARRVSAAARLITFVGVLPALITAAAESGFPGALRILGTVGFGAVAVLALSLAVLRLDVPLAESSIDTVVLLEEVAELVAFSVEDVPHTVSLGFASTFGEFTVDAILLALAVDPDAHLGGGTFLDESIGGEGRIFGGKLVVTVLEAASSGDGAVPHAPGVGIASGSSGVLVTALLAARAGRGVPFALVPLTAVRFVAEVAEAAAVALGGVPFAGLAGVAIFDRADHVARAAAGGTVDGVSLVPVAFLVESTQGGVLISSIGVDEVAVFALLLAGFVRSPFAHTTTSLGAEGLRVLERAGDAALVLVGVPHATAVGVAATTVVVGSGAVVNALVVDEGAGGVSSTVGLADAEVGDVVVAVARVAALGLSDVPLALGLLVAVGFVVVAVRALVDAASLVVLADFDDLAGSVILDGSTLAGADGAVVVPLAAGVFRAGTISLEAEGTRAAAAGEGLVAPSSLRLFEAASSLEASGLIRVQIVASALITFNDVNVAGGEGVGVPDTFRPAAASGGTRHAFARNDALRAAGRPHAVFIRAGGLGVEAFGADGLALGGEGAPVAESVDDIELTFSLVADDGAFLVALRKILTPLTHLVTFASALATELLAVFAAGLVGDVPHAEAVTIADTLSLVAVVAARLADSG